jgi:hypothetical protein
MDGLRTMDDQVTRMTQGSSGHPVTFLSSLHHFHLTMILNMKLVLALLALLPLALAAKSLKSVVVTFPEGTPDSVIEQAKDSLVASVCAAFDMIGFDCRLTDR